MKKVCINLDCAKEYEVGERDDGYCCFDCWERDNCGQPMQVTQDVDGIDWLSTTHD
jgi:hypothetical protein